MSDERNGLVRHVHGFLEAATSGASTLGVAVVALWVAHGINVLVYGEQLLRYGILPRTRDGLWGVLFAPFLHGSVTHLFFNTMFLVLFGAMTMVRRRSDFVWVSLISGLTAGLGTWAFGLGGPHIGASGVVFGYLGFLMARGLFDRNVLAILLSAGVTWFFGSMVSQVLPVAGPISWESHLFGFVGGLVSAGTLSRPGRARGGTARRARARP